MDALHEFPNRVLNAPRHCAWCQEFDDPILGGLRRKLSSRGRQRKRGSGSRPRHRTRRRRASCRRLGASCAAKLAAAPRPLAIPLQAWRRAWFSPKLHGGPQPPWSTPPRSVACSTARRCAAALGRPAAGIAWRLVQAKPGRRPTAASHHSTSESRALRSSPLRRGSGVPLCAARRA